MRKLAIRSAAVALVATVGLAAADQPLVLPPPKPVEEPRKLRTELEALAAEREAAAKELTDTPSSSAERAKLRAQLLELIKKLGEKKPAPMVPPMPPATHTPAVVKEPPPMPAVPKFLPGDGFGPIDPVRAAQNYFRANDIDAAFRTLKLIDTNTLSREDRAFVQYLTACCYRKMNQPAEAMKLFREVADAKEDDFLAEWAVWQLGTMKSIQELEANLEQLRSRRKSK